MSKLQEFKNILIYLIVSAIGATAVVVFLPDSVIFRELGVGHPALPNSWFHIAHTMHNAFFTWSLPFGIGSLFFTSINLQDLLLFIKASYLALLWFGSLLVIRNFNLGSNSKAIYLAIIPVLLIIFWHGLDLTILATLSVTPLIVIFLQRPLGLLSSILIALLLGCITFEIANQLAPLSVFFALLGYAALRDLSNNSQPVALKLYLLLLPIIFGLIIAPLPIWPGYPADALLISSTGLTGHIHPYFAPSFPLPILERELLKSVFFIPSLIFAALGFLLYLVSSLQNNSQRVGILLGTLMLLVALATISEETLAQISPILSLIRVIPHLFYFSLEPLFFAAAIFLSLLFLLARGQIKSFTVCAVVFCLGQIFHSPQKIESNFFLFKHDVISYFQSTDLRTRQRIASPSLATLQEQGPWPLNKIDRVRQAYFYFDGPSGFNLLASDQVDFAPLSNATDGDLTTRWAISGGQKGGEWLSIEFPDEQIVSGIELLLGPFFTDYPRGLEFYNLPSCQKPATNQDTPFLRVAPWQGPLKTTPLGYFYHGELNQVEILFPEDIQTRCLHIVQRGESRFDWSITEIGFAKIRD